MKYSLHDYILALSYANDMVLPDIARLSNVTLQTVYNQMKRPQTMQMRVFKSICMVTGLSIQQLRGMIIDSIKE